MNLFRQQLYDRYKKQGMSDEDALMKADRMSQVGGLPKGVGEALTDVDKYGVVKKPVEQTEKKPSWLELAWYGEKWYRRKKLKEEKGKTVRTSATERGLSEAGITDTEMARLRRRK